MSVAAIANHIDVSSSSAIRVRSGAIVAILLTAGSDTATLVLYDNNTTDSGTKLATVKVRANTSFVWQPSLPYAFDNGIFAVIVGTSANATVVYI